jgi:hypothetical protein
MQSLSSIPVAKVCPVCDKPEDVSNYPENPFVQVWNGDAVVLMHNACRKKSKLDVWSR